MGKLRALAKRLSRDTDGIILPYVTLILVVIVGVAVLALDGARYMSLQTQLQNAADSLALTGAAELDRLPGSEVRAKNAMRALLASSGFVRTGLNKSVQLSSIRFFRQLPASDDSPLSDGVPASDSTNARFLAIKLRPVTMTTVLPAALFGGASNVTTGASAVAGFDQVVCQATPLFVCNPYETSNMTYYDADQALQDAAVNPEMRRRLIRLRQYSGPNRPYLPGDYGFLLTPATADEGGLLDALANVHPPVCFVQRGVTFRPGFVSTVREGLNVRFDIYEGAMLSNRSSSDYRPAENVRKGYVGGGRSETGNACSAQPATNWPIGSPPNQATGLSLDRRWPYMGGRMGDGTWDFATYWQVNHAGDGRPPPLVNGRPATNADPPSRYAVYRYELQQGYVTDRSAGGESGAPACYSGGELSDGPDRRIVYAAIINCQSLALEGGAHSGVPVAAFGKFFLTLPLSRSQTDLYAELVGLVGPGDKGNFDMVQLYR